MSSRNLQGMGLGGVVGRSWWLILLFGVMSTVFGVMAIVNPISAGAGLTWAVGILAIAEGALTLVAALRKDVPFSRGWLLFYAVVSLVFGVMAVVNPISMAATLVTVTGAWFIVAGVMRIVWAVRIRKEIDNEWPLILVGVLGVAIGLMLLLAPIAGLIVAVIWLGVGALLYGLLQIYVAFKIRKLG